MGIGHAVNTGFANNGILTIMSYYGEGTSLGQFAAYLIGIAVAFFGGAILTYIVGFEDVDAAPAGAAALESDLAMPAAPSPHRRNCRNRFPGRGKGLPVK